MKITDLKLENRAAQPYVGVRTEVPWTEFPVVIPKYIDEVFAWLGQQGIEPDGPPLMRYNVINMEEGGKMDVEIGVPIAKAVAGNGHIKAGELPAGRYASLVYTGVENGIAGNGALIDWAVKEGLKWDQFDSDKGDGFVSRVEFFIDGPADDPDSANWRTEVAIKVAD
jgi:effector-binding domain-containing protein